MKEPVIQHFTGSFDGYVPPLIGNGDIGGSFDPFCGTWFDELRSIPDQKEDIRSLLLARFVAQDYWQETHLDPHIHPLAEDTRRYLLKHDQDPYTYSSVTRGSPFEFFIGPVDRTFPSGVQEHAQRLDIDQGILSAEYVFKGMKHHVECFVHPQLSLLTYQVEAGGAMEFRVRNRGDDTEPTVKHKLDLAGMCTETVYTFPQGNALFIRSCSNIFCPGLAAVWSDRGQPEQDRVVLPAGRSVIYLAYGHMALKNPEKQIEDTLAYARNKGYDGLRKEQSDWWTDFWNRSDISLPDPRMQQMYYRSLYYNGVSQARKTKTPCFEAGISGSFPSFQTGYHIQDGVYQILPLICSNHLELVEPMLEWYLDVLPVAKENARSVYWLDGARYIWHGGPGMLPYIPGHTHYYCCSHEHHVNGWVVLAIERYLSACGWDRDKARRYYPVVSEIARFFSSMLTPKDGGKYEIRYLPAHSQGEGEYAVNRPNTFDVLASARWCLLVAARMNHLLGVDAAEARRWKHEADGIDFSPLCRKDGAYALFEGQKDETYKICTQFIGVIMPIGLDRRRLLATYDLMQKQVNFGCCSFDPGYAAISLARLRQTELAFKQLGRIFTEDYTEEPWIMFRESAASYMKFKRGRMPYFLTGHATYSQAIQEMLVQDWTGKTELFPACAFGNASFRLLAGSQMVEASKAGKSVTSAAEPQPD